MLLRTTAIPMAGWMTTIQFACATIQFWLKNCLCNNTVFMDCLCWCIFYISARCWCNMAARRSTKHTKKQMYKYQLLVHILSARCWCNMAARWSTKHTKKSPQMIGAELTFNSPTFWPHGIKWWIYTQCPSDRICTKHWGPSFDAKRTIYARQTFGLLWMASIKKTRSWIKTWIHCQPCVMPTPYLRQ